MGMHKDVVPNRLRHCDADRWVYVAALRTLFLTVNTFAGGIEECPQVYQLLGWGKLAILEVDHPTELL